MGRIKEYCKAKYYLEYNSEKLLSEVQAKVSPDITSIEHEMIYIYHKILSSDPCYYWDKGLLENTIHLLEDLYLNNSSALSIDEDIFNYFLMGYNSYCQLIEIITDLRNFNISSEIKTRLYRIPTYTSILEGCLANFYRVIALLLGQAYNKDYASQNTMGQLVNVLNSNGFNELTKDANVNMRNAINHGKVNIKREALGEKICFHYVENRIPCTLEIAMYEFDKIIDNAYDAASSVLLGLTTLFNRHMDLLNIDTEKKGYVQFSLQSMRLSLPGIYCSNISDTSNNKQLNIEIKIDNTDRGYIAQIATLLSIIVYEKYDDYEQYMFSFSNERMISGWVRYTNEEIHDMYNENRAIDDVLKDVIERKDCMIFDPSTEDINLNEIKYHCFPNYRDDRFIINNIQDSSIKDRKRLRAHLYIGDTSSKQEIIDIINDAIAWLKTVKNVPSPTMYHKSGDMDADSLYINVYKKDLRQNKELFTSNDNFVCMVDYNINGETTLKNGGIFEGLWNKLYHEKIGNMTIAWREGKYFARIRAKKIGSNEPCPCGSGKKFKKCCRDKGIYD